MTRPVITPAQAAVLRDAAQGLSVYESANRRHISPRTVQTHRGAILGALGASRMAHAVALGYELGVLKRGDVDVPQKLISRTG